MEETDLSIEETYEKVKALISKSELEKALLVLIEKFESEQIVLQYSRLSFLKKNLIDGTLSIQEAQIENAKIAKAILILAKELTRKNNLLKKIRVSNRLRLIELILRKRGNKLILIFSLLILFNLRNFKYFLFWMIIGIGIIFGINYMVSDEGDLILINPNSNNSKVAKIPKAPNYFCIQNIEVISSDEKIKAKITSNTTVTFYDLEKKLGISTLDNIDTIVDIKFTPTGNNLRTDLNFSNGLQLQPL